MIEFLLVLFSLIHGGAPRHFERPTEPVLERRTHPGSVVPNVPHRGPR